MKYILCLFSVLVWLSSCKTDTKSSRNVADHPTEVLLQLTDQQIRNAGVATGKISASHVSSLLKLNGKIDVPPQSMVSISVPLGGYLKSTNLLPGMHVSKGEVLAILQDAQYIQLQQDFLTAKAQLVLIESEFNRQKELNLSKASSDKVYEQAKAAYTSQYVLLRSLEEKLKLIGLDPAKLSAENINNSISIKSPITGFVSAVNVNIGKYVHSSDVLFELVDPSDIHLALSVFEKDINKLFIGQKLMAFTNSNPALKFPCEIILISRNLSEQNSVAVHCHFQQYDKSLLPGMFMNAEVEVNDKLTPVLPDESIVRFNNQQYAFISKGGNRFEMHPMHIGNSENGFSEVLDTSGITGFNFVTKGAYNLLMAAKNKGVD